MRRFLLSLVAVSAAVATVVTTASAAPFSAAGQTAVSAHSDVQLAGSKGGPKVKGYAERRGGYSYSQEDSINTYGDARSKYGAASSLRDPALDRQSESGPFDHGFFFDSAVGARGGDSPYMN